MDNIILYGCDNSDKYLHSTEICRKYSKSNLKFKRKIEIIVNDVKYYFILSDIHIEVDFQLLGNNQQAIWYALYNHIDTICNQVMDNCIILCLNMHMIKDELLQLFYVFLKKSYIKYIFCTKNISFLPDSLTNLCHIICVKKNNNKETINYYTLLCKPIINCILDKNVNYSLIRDSLYELLIYNLDIHECLYYIICQLHREKYIQLEDIDKIMEQLYIIMKRYNNNYRTIYHLECFVIYLMLFKR